MPGRKTLRGLRFIKPDPELVKIFFEWFQSTHPSCDRSCDGRTLRAGDVLLEWDPDVCEMLLSGEDANLDGLDKFMPARPPVADEMSGWLRTPERAAALAEMRRRAGLPA